MILNNIPRAVFFQEKRQSDFSNGILTESLRNKQNAKEGMPKNYPVILFNLENWYGQAEQYEKVLKLSETSLDICIHYGKLDLFPYRLFNRRYSLAGIGNSKIYFNQAFTIFLATKNLKDYEFGKKKKF